MTRKFQRSPLALAVLVLLHEAPMHPYRMQRLIKDRGKDQVINVGQRASLYQTISQLLREGLITFWGTTQQEGFPERTVYKLTDKGHETAVAWMRDMLSTPDPEFPEFPAAVSLLPLLRPEDALAQLEKRAGRLESQIAAIDAEGLATAGSLPRLFLLEDEYRRAVLAAELGWVRAVSADLRSGQLTWNDEWMRPDRPPEDKNIYLGIN
jgi:DNA-binding PadR family transcriptional regulator